MNTNVIKFIKQKLCFKDNTQKMSSNNYPAPNVVPTKNGTNKAPVCESSKVLDLKTATRDELASKVCELQNTLAKKDSEIIHLRNEIDKFRQVVKRLTEATLERRGVKAVHPSGACVLQQLQEALQPEDKDISVTSLGNSITEIQNAERNLDHRPGVHIEASGRIKRQAISAEPISESIKWKTIVRIPKSAE